MTTTAVRILRARAARECDRLIEKGGIPLALGVLYEMKSRLITLPLEQRVYQEGLEHGRTEPPAVAADTARGRALAIIASTTDPGEAKAAVLATGISRRTYFRARHASANSANARRPDDHHTC